MDALLAKNRLITLIDSADRGYECNRLISPVIKLKSLGFIDHGEPPYGLPSLAHLIQEET
jgi:hypothetical protein